MSNEVRRYLIPGVMFNDGTFEYDERCIAPSDNYKFVCEADYDALNARLAEAEKVIKAIQPNELGAASSQLRKAYLDKWGSK